MKSNIKIKIKLTANQLIGLDRDLRITAEDYAQLTREADDAEPYAVAIIRTRKILGLSMSQGDVVVPRMAVADGPIPIPAIPAIDPATMQPEAKPAEWDGNTPDGAPAKLEIIAGCYYKTRDDGSAYVESIDPAPDLSAYPCRGYSLSEGVWGERTWTKTGLYVGDGNKCSDDLMTELDKSEAEKLPPLTRPVSAPAPEGKPPEPDYDIVF